MRTLKESVAGLPAGTEYDVFERAGVRRIRWRTADFLGAWQGARIDGIGTLAKLTPALDLFDHHVSLLGVNPEEEVPCGNCGCQIAACLTKCPECEKDPDADVPCPECEDGNGEPTGYVEVAQDRSAQFTTTALCPTCGGQKTLEGANAGEREAAIAAAKGWKAGQAVEAVPAGIGEQP